MRIGIHVRVSGGYAKAIEHARTAKCTAIQIFSSNPRSYRPTKIDAVALRAFAQMRMEAGIAPCVIHTPYLINLASDDPKKRDGSITLLRADLATAAVGEIEYVNTHLGSYGVRDRNEGFAAVVSGLEAALDGIAPGVGLVLENSAGAGNLVGGTLDELGRYVRAVDHPQLGVCLDTAHAWAAGYAINTKDGVDRFVDEASEKIGLDRIKLFHFNDTEVPLGGSRDRHFHIGEGLIGYDGFRALLAHPELQSKAAILETPGEEADDIRNMQTILALERAALGR
ncbi:MAG TPA: deoxyribonuclease IV [Candidatus Baltobacteraceae bacterium]|nr:deoxyribonuclease IV [Candidatus Baltobacteraceae bacterium]